MTDEVTPKGPKPSETLNEASLVSLARGLGKEPDSLSFPMLLNLPTTTIINIIYEINEDGLRNDATGSLRATVVEKCVLKWKEYTKEGKNRDNIKVIEKALREMGKTELADAVMDRYLNHLEISEDLFA